MAKKITALCPWYGSGRTTAENVGNLLKGRSHVAVPFAGGMCELLYIGASTLLVNDKHRSIINLATTVADPVLGPKLIRRLRRTAFHPAILKVSQQFCKDFSVDLIAEKSDWAYHYFITAWMSRNGVAGTKGEFDAGFSVRYDSGGGDSAIRFRSATEALLDWRKVLPRATFSTDDAFDMIGRCKDHKKSGIYCDAPWPDDGGNYTHGFSESDQRRLAVDLFRFKETRVVVRYGDHPLIRELYPEADWQWNSQTGRTSANKDKAEVLLVNRSSI